MISSTFFYLLFDIVLLGYTCYSWYWQASINLKGRYRVSSIIWTVLIIWAGFAWEFLEKSDPDMTMFLAIFLLMGIIDGFTGLTPKRAVVSGYFKRTIAYPDIATVTLIKVPNPKKKIVICIFTTNKHQQYYVRFSKDVIQIIDALKTRLNHGVQIEVQDIL